MEPGTGEMMKNARRKIGIVCCLFFLVGCVGCDASSGTASAETSAQKADDSSEDSSASNGETETEGEGDETKTLDGTDVDAFDASWQAINEGLSENERLRFDLAVLAAVVSELEPEDRREEIDVSSMLEALDGKTAEQVNAIAQEQIGGDLDLEQLTSEEVREISEEVGFDVTDEFSLADIVDVVKSEFGPREKSSEPIEPQKRFAQLAARLSELVEMYYITHGELPESLEQLTRGRSQLIEEVPQDPWGNDLIYEIEGDTDFTIISKGADGQRGTDEDLVVDY